MKSYFYICIGVREVLLEVFFKLEFLAFYCIK